MTMSNVLVGAALVCLTWTIFSVAVVALGLPVAVSGARDRREALRKSLWWGLAVMVTVVLWVSLGVPLGTSTTLLVFLGITLSMGFVGMRRIRRLQAAKVHDSRSTWVVGLALAVSVIYLAMAALGPVSNYDSGLYHLGALRYQQEFGLIPGIANLYFPLGYSNSLTSLSAFIGSTPWDLNGFRLINGLLLVISAVDVMSRLRSRLWSPGTMLMLGSLIFVWIPLTALSDYWVTSPTSDSAILILTTVSVAYLADGLALVARNRSMWSDFSVSAVTSFVLVSMRPTMVIFSITVLLVGLAAFVWRTRIRPQSPLRNERGSRLLTSLLIVTGLLLALAQILRDRVLSGWLQYPLSVFAFDVPWRANDPVWFRTATLGAARDPEDLWNAAEGWDWVPGWIGRSLMQWESAMVVVLTAVSIVLIALVRFRRIPLRIRPLVAACSPSAVAVAVWFLASPPAFRFIWGPLFTLAALPGAWAAYRLKQERSLTHLSASKGAAVPGSLAAALLGVVTFSLMFRWDGASLTEQSSFNVGPIAVPYVVSPITVPEISTATLESGLVIISPMTSDQCWNQYPLCTPLIDQTVTLAGSGISDGFLP